MEQLEGKVAVVTGAASGIGRALAVELARNGMTIVAADIDATNLDETLLAVHQAGCRALAIRTDVSRADDMEALAAQVTEEFGGTDLLCLNAGVFRGGLVWESPLDDWNWVFSINVYGIIHGIRAFVPRMIERGTEGHVEITSSMAGLVATGMSGIYTVSKFAAFALAEVLANDLASTGAPIGVSVLCPSAVATGIADSQRNREGIAEELASATTVEDFLRDFCADGLDPAEVAATIVAAVRRGDFLIPTRETFAEFVRVRADALTRKALPPFQMFD
jgi:NAD(P)-dependent dehydrogenase (short-subunit alcohol dehydrogenase family)